MELPDEEVGEEFEIADDEDTIPGTWIKFPQPTMAGSSLLKGLKPKASGNGQLNLPTWDDLHSDSKHPPLTPGQRKAMKILDDHIERTTGRSIVDMLDEEDKKDLDNG